MAREVHVGTMSCVVSEVAPWILVVSGREGIVWLRHQRAEVEKPEKKRQIDQEGWQGWQAAKAGRTPREGLGRERKRGRERGQVRGW